MSTPWDPEDVSILLESIKTRQRLPRTLVNDLEAVEHMRKEKTERIFFDYGGRTAWAAYALTKRAASATGHVTGRGKRQRLISRLQRSSFESRRSLAEQLNSALGSDERERVDRLLEIHQAHLQRNRRQTEGSRESSMITENQQETSDNLTNISANITSPILRKPILHQQAATDKHAARCGILLRRWSYVRGCFYCGVYRDVPILSSQRDSQTA
ncbi:hypothetical protein KVR01_001662 [Diaporthe batatas]|uniref:uncharacterized protein n=1 Tax=Diaporthe batatas TaxID=748121 RepID=UPI001D05239A|nr:uncharacterized protein KVR01_001662 [Diaporthe batatas]KAG8168913.1 hypothetical protein KVR01_001662 [Diaporthe batatas]